MSGKSEKELSQTANAVLVISSKENVFDGFEDTSGLPTMENGVPQTNDPHSPQVDGLDDIERQRLALSATVQEMRRFSQEHNQDRLQDSLNGLPLPYPETYAEESNQLLPLGPSMDGSFPDDSQYLLEDAGNATPFLGSAASVGESEAPRIQAFAKLEFDDGQFYMNTYAVELGRDVRAARAALARDLEVSQKSGSVHNGPNSSGGNVSQNANRVKQSGSGAVAASIVSEKAGIIGIDPVPQPRRRKKSKKSKSKSKSTSSSSQLVSRRNKSDVVQETRNYQTLAMESLYDQPHPVDAENLLPSPDEIPLIPIHPPADSEEANAAFRGISRRHVRIAFNFQKHLFEVEIKGRNGVFVDDVFYTKGNLIQLKSGSFLQIGGVGVKFLLPDTPLGETGAEGSEPEVSPSSIPSSIEEEEEEEEGEESDAMRIARSSEDEGGEVQESVEEVPRPGKGKGKSKQQPKPQSESTSAQGMLTKKRGPGRPPKDGISSKREKAELARAAKLAAKKEANGGLTPPPTGKGKLGQPRSGSIQTTEPKQEKRKYTKRKKSETSPQEFDEEEEVEIEESPKTKDSAPKRERSPSPEYGKESDYTAEQLQKPKESYQYLVYDLLKETPPHQMDLKDIYRGLKKKYPYYVFKVDTPGWQSSVRHNLNQIPVFKKVEKAGKGWLWGLDPSVTLPNDRKRRNTPPQPHPNPIQSYGHQGPQLIRYPPHTGPMAPPLLPQHTPHLQNGFLPPGGPMQPLAAPPPSSYTSPYQSPYGPPIPPQSQPEQFYIPQNGNGQPQQHQTHKIPAPPARSPSPPIWPTVSYMSADLVANIKAFRAQIMEDPAHGVIIDSAIDRALGFKFGGKDVMGQAERTLVGIMESLVGPWGWKKEMANIKRGTKRPRDDDDDENEEDVEKDGKCDNDVKAGDDEAENDDDQDDDAAKTNEDEE